MGLKERKRLVNDVIVNECKYINAHEQHWEKRLFLILTPPREQAHNK